MNNQCLDGCSCFLCKMTETDVSENKIKEDYAYIKDKFAEAMLKSAKNLQDITYGVDKIDYSRKDVKEWGIVSEDGKVIPILPHSLTAISDISNVLSSTYSSIGSSFYYPSLSVSGSNSPQITTDCLSVSGSNSPQITTDYATRKQTKYAPLSYYTKDEIDAKDTEIAKSIVNSYLEYLAEQKIHKELFDKYGQLYTDNYNIDEYEETMSINDYMKYETNRGEDEDIKAKVMKMLEMSAFL